VAIVVDLCVNSPGNHLKENLLKLLTDRYQNKLSGVLSCYDRIVITGTLPHLCYARGMADYLYKNQIRIFDYPRFAEPFREQLRANAQALAKAHGIEIEHIRKSHIRKEEIVQTYLSRRGDAPGLVCILSAMESCDTYKPWHDKQTHRTFLKADVGKCLHYYFYFIDPQLGLCYVRVPTWCPFRLQIYFNGHHWLANRLKSVGIGYEFIDNAFVSIDDFHQAQQIADQLDINTLHQILDRFAAIYCPVYQQLGEVYHWSIMQAEYATDIVFTQQADLQAIYSQLIHTAIHTVKPENISTFLGRKLVGQYRGEVGNRYNVRLEGSRIKHCMGSNSIKMYDKFSQILRIETTTNDVSFFKHYRTVEHRDGSTTQKNAAMKKTIYSLPALRECLQAANRRYLEFISAIEDQSVGRKNLYKISRPTSENNRNYKGFNFFDEDDFHLLCNILRGEFNINGFQNKHLQQYLPFKNSGQISRLLKRLRNHGLIKKIRNSYKYYLTQLGKQVILTALKIKELVIIPKLNDLKTA